MRTITVLLAEDHAIVREGFRKMLELEADLQVVGEAQDGRQAVVLAQKLLPAVVLMDIAMPLLNGLEAMRQILKNVPATKVLMLSAHNDDAYVESATGAGAVGFLLKQSSAHEVCRAIRQVHVGKTFLSSSISRRPDRLNPPSRAQAGLLTRNAVRLTAREMEVLQFVAEGKLNKQAASEMCLSIKTVEKHRERLTKKLGIRGIADLTRFAINAGIIECDPQTAIA